MTPKQQTFIKLLHDAFGNVSSVCRQLKMSRQTYYDWMKEDEEFKLEVDSISEYIVDSVEKELYKQIKDGSAASTIFYLKTKGKHRGYVEKQEIDHTSKGESVAPQINIVKPE